MDFIVFKNSQMLYWWNYKFFKHFRTKVEFSNGVLSSKKSSCTRKLILLPSKVFVNFLHPNSLDIKKIVTVNRYWLFWHQFFHRLLINLSVFWCTYGFDCKMCLAQIGYQFFVLTKCFITFAVNLYTLLF